MTRVVSRALWTIAVMAVLVAPVCAQSDDEAGRPVGPTAGPTTVIRQGSGSLTTTFAGGNSFAGNTFDIENIGTLPVTITGWDVHLSNAGSTNTIVIYTRPGTSNGYQSDPNGWTVLGTDAAVVSAGNLLPSAVTMPPFTIQPGELFGFYVDLASYVSGGTALQYTNGGPNTYTNSEIELTTYYGKGNPAFSGSTFTYRAWNGTVHYDIVPVELQSFSVE